MMPLCKTNLALVGRMRGTKWGREGGGCGGIQTRTPSFLKPLEALTLSWPNVCVDQPQAAGTGGGRGIVTSHPPSKRLWGSRSSSSFFHFIAC